MLDSGRRLGSVSCTHHLSILFLLGKILPVIISSHLSSRRHDRRSRVLPIFLFLLVNIIKILPVIIWSHLSSRRHDRRSKVICGWWTHRWCRRQRRHDRPRQDLPIFLFLLANIKIISSHLSSRRG